MYPPMKERSKVKNLDDVWIVIAAYNEAEVIGNVICQLIDEVTPNVLVVDDGSVDDTKQKAVQAGAIVIRHSQNLGQGAAIQTGFSYLCNKEFSYAVTFDADGQHQYQDVYKMVELANSSKADIILGSRFLGKTENMSARKKILLSLAVAFTNLTSGVKLTDSHNGLRLLTRETVHKITIDQQGMAHASEFIHEIAKHDLKWKEIPVTIKYTEYSVSKGQRLSNSISIILDLIIRKLYK
ncbi:glycosyltransferase family 2 protein [Vibrio kyushuensis]|uniref:glycosyltransferase family 2 protein n=1 Tax=Vibrio kyushuensis TaxID=2910249 RepID=UPI003D0CE3D3